MRYDGTSGEWAGLDATQSIRLTLAATGTALIGRASGRDGFRIVGAGVGVEQAIGRHMTVSGALDHTSDATDLIASVKARYSLRW